MERRKEIGYWMWVTGGSIVVAMALVHGFTEKDEQGRENIVVRTEKGCLVSGPAANDWEECPPAPSQILAATPEYHSPQPAQVPPEHSNSLQESISSDPIKAAIDAKNSGDQFEVVDRWGNRYLVEKTGRAKLEVITILEQNPSKLIDPTIIPIRDIREVR